MEEKKKYGTAVLLESGGKLRVALHSEGSREIRFDEARDISMMILHTLTSPKGDFTLVGEDA